MRTVVGLAVVLMIALSTTGCENAGSDRITQLDATGTIQGSLVVDENGSRALDPGDSPAASRSVALVLHEVGDTVATTTTGSSGSFAFTQVPVGRFLVVVPETVLGDTFRVAFRDPPGEAIEDGLSTVLPPPPPITLGREDTTDILLGIGFPRLSVPAARTAPAGVRFFVAGQALTQIDEFGEGSVYIRGGAAAIRATRVQPASVAPGDSVHAVGTGASRANQPVLRDARSFVLSAGPAPEPRTTDVATARSASGGEYDADLVRVPSITVADTTREGTRFRIISDDPDEPIETIIHPDGSYDFSRFGPGAVLDVTGILVPDSTTGLWRLWPRSGQDVIVVSSAPSN